MTDTTTDPYAHLDDPAERKWLTEVEPQDVLRNAHRIYDFMHDGGIPGDSYTRELAFQKAATALGIDYDVLYNAWVHQTPAGTEDESGYKSRAAQQAARSKYGTKRYWDYLEASALEKAAKFPDRAEEFMSRSLGEAAELNGVF